jgi:phenylacetate-coenzyme A ligase PaaK-like adenylate-forming protein
MNNDVDVNILVNVYTQKISNLLNQNILLEAKMQSLVQDYEDEKNKLLIVNLELQKKYDDLIKNKTKKLKEEDKYEEAGF